MEVNNDSYYSDLAVKIHQSKNRIQQLMYDILSRSEKLEDEISFKLRISEFVINSNLLQKAFGVIEDGYWKQNNIDGEEGRNLLINILLESIKEPRKDNFIFFAFMADEGDFLKRQVFGEEFSPELDYTDMLEFMWKQEYLLGIIEGEMGSGKTNSMLKIPEEMHRYYDDKFILVTNIFLKTEETWINQMYNNYEMWYYIAKNPNKKVWIVFDEAKNSFSTQRGFFSTPTEFLNTNIPMLRKLKCGFFFIYQSDRYQDKIVNDLKNFDIKKSRANKRILDIIINGGMDNERIGHFETSITSVDYDSDQPAQFEFVMDEKAMYMDTKRMSSWEFREWLKNNIDNWSVVKNWIEPKEHDKFLSECGHYFGFLSDVNEIAEIIIDCLSKNNNKSLSLTKLKLALDLPAETIEKGLKKLINEKVVKTKISKYKGKAYTQYLLSEKAEIG